MERWNRLSLSTLTIGVLVAVAACSGSSGDGASANATNDSGDGAWAPGGNVTMMVTGSPGGGSDQMAREFASVFDAENDVTMVVENFDPIEAYSVMKAAAGDPDRILTMNYGGAVILPVSQNLDYNWRDFSTVGIIGLDYSYIVTRADGPFATLDDLFAAAAERPITVGQVSAGGHNTMLTQQVEKAAGIDFEPVVFEGGGQQLSATLSGDVDFAVMEPAEFIQQLEAGGIRALASLSPEALDIDLLDDVPTAAEAGLPGDFSPQWRGFFAAPDISEEQLEWWRGEVAAWTESAEYDDYVTANLIDPAWIVGAELDEFLERAEADAVAELGQ